MQRWLNPRYRQGQDFYNGVANLEKVSSQRPFITPILFLVIKHYADRFNLVDYFNRIIVWDEKQWKLSPGILVLSLIYCCFLSEDGKVPLYKISEYLKGLDLFLLFGQPLRAEDFNDDLYANLLDQLGKMGSMNILGKILDLVYNPELGFN